MIKHPIILSTTEPNNHIGVIKVRQADDETQTFMVTVTEQSIPKDLTGYEVFFCINTGTTKGIVENKVTDNGEIINAQKGKFSYTLTPYDWQQLGKVTAYFDFRITDKNNSILKRFSTRNFNYTVIPNAFSNGISDSNYVWTFEDLLRLFKEWIANGQGTFEEWFDNIKDLLGTDPAGQLAMKIGLMYKFREFDESIIEKMSNEFHERGLNIVWYGANGDGISDSSFALKKVIDEMKNLEGTIIIPSGNFFINENVFIPENIKLSILKGGKLVIGNNAEVRIDGVIDAGDYEIFIDAGGTIDKHNSASPYNISWYSGETINKKYDFARKDFEEFKNKIIKIPKPVSGQSGTFDDGKNRIYWACDGEILIDDFGNAAEWYIEGEFIAISDFDSFIKVKGANKPENVYFYGTVQMLVPNGKNVKNGINIVEGARINFYDQVVINGCETSIVLGGDGQIAPSTAFFNLVQCSFYKFNAIKIDGRNIYPNSIDANVVSITSAQKSGTDAVLITGLVRDFKIGKILYAADSKDGFIGYEAENVVHIQSYEDKSVRFGLIESIFTTQAENAIKISDINNAGNGDRIQFITVDRIYKKYDGSAFKINHCTDVTISRIFNSGANSTSTIGSVAVATEVLNNGGEKILDTGLYSVIGNVGKQTRGGGVPPSPALNWKIGTFILETTDNRLYLRVSKNGIASDFISIK